jgi:predicted O-linked N-acetylglucosamine transferase (SPINDLY family)
MNRRQRRQARRERRRPGGKAGPDLAAIAALGEAGRFAEAARLARERLAARPRDVEARHLLGLALMQMGRIDEAVAELEACVAAEPGRALWLSHLAAALATAGRAGDGVLAARRAVEAAPAFADGWFNLGKAAEAAGLALEAERAYREAARLKPGHALAWNNLGNLLQTGGRHREAVGAYRRALAAEPDGRRARYNLATALMAEGEAEAAEREFRALLAADPAHAEALNNLGALVERQGRLAEALALFERAAAARPEMAEGWFNLGNLLDKADRLAEAETALRRAAELAPQSPKTLGALVHTLRKACAWDGLDALGERLRALVLAGAADADGQSLSPFSALSLPFTEAEQREVARRHARWLERSARGRLLPPPPSVRDRLRVGYLSADFREHPVAHLMAGVFPLHDRRRFAVHGYSVGVDDGSQYRRRIAAAIERFVDMAGAPAQAIAGRIRDDGIDVLVDLTGYTAHGRSEVLALRPAPVQVNYLGYPGTMGADFVDFILADAIVIPPQAAPHFDERVVHLPGSYQPNERVPIPDWPISRRDLGLPAGGFVYCCFSGSYKIDPPAFDRWMSILRTVPDAVLWLFRSHAAVEANLRREAEARGIPGGRLVFAERLPKPRHLARHRLADLFLDTFRYGAHTTASDALWAGVPVLTCAGDTFAGRVGASLLTAVGLPELIARDAQAYEREAVALARDPGRLADLRRRLLAALGACPLFDAAASARHLEAAYEEMWRRRGEGRGPPIAIAP